MSPNIKLVSWLAGVVVVTAMLAGGGVWWWMHHNQRKLELDESLRIVERTNIVIRERVKVLTETNRIIEKSNQVLERRIDDAEAIRGAGLDDAVRLFLYMGR